MHSRRRLVISVVVATGLLAVAGVVVSSVIDNPPPGDGPRVVQPGAPGQPGRTLSNEELSDLSPPAHTAADTLFMQRMIQHHAQALQMTSLVADRSQRSDLALLAERIDITQRDEIALMQRWLSDRGEPTAAPHTSHTEAMPGMLTIEQVNQLERARGTEFDRLFLEFMIIHHQGALVMVGQLYAAGGGLEPDCDRLARDITADQSIEIRRMQDMLAGNG